MKQADITAEIDRLKRLLAAREGVAGFTTNCAAIRLQIEKHENMTPYPEPEPAPGG